MLYGQNKQEGSNRREFIKSKEIEDYIYKDYSNSSPSKSITTPKSLVLPKITHLSHFYSNKNELRNKFD